MFTEIEYLQDRKAAEIAQLIVSNNPLIITSNYKGIILTQPIRVLSIMPGRVICQAPESTLCFTLKENIQLYSPELGEIVSARLLTLNTVMGRLELEDLIFTGRRWNEHQYDRVQPRDSICVSGEYKEALIRANLDNLSVGGMSLIVCRDREMALDIDRDSDMRLTLQLPGDDAHLEFQGKVVHSRQAGRLAILGIQLMASGAQEKRINRYVMARKVEILAELERTSHEAFEHHWMPGLYY